MFRYSAAGLIAVVQPYCLDQKFAQYRGCPQSDEPNFMKAISMLCSVNDAARMLGIGRTKVYDMLAKGHLASMQIGTRRLVKIDSIKALIDRATGGVA
jgi:excisionase family DNA binding protein